MPPPPGGRSTPRRASDGFSFGPVARALLLATAVKLLLVPCYKSTDFEVHRNWLAVAGTLPVARWYTEATSQWTLDYPPLFGWFERGLARLAPLFDAGMLSLQAEPYDTPNTVLFQRGSVIVCDVVLMLGILWQTSGGGGRGGGAGGGGVTPRGGALHVESS
jgi:alpha-1,3-glucosyltransferase